MSNIRYRFDDNKVKMNQVKLKNNKNTALAMISGKPIPSVFAVGNLNCAGHGRDSHSSARIIHIEKLQTESEALGSERKVNSANQLEN